MAEEEQDPPVGAVPTRNGVVRRTPHGRTFKRMRDGHVDAGVRSTAANEAPRPKLHPPMRILQHYAHPDLPGPEWTDPPSNH